MQGKTAAHQKQLVKSIVTELIRNGRVKTTPAKAKVVKKYFDKLVTKAKKQTPGAQQKVASFFAENDRSIKRFAHIVETYLQDRNSGYTRVIKTLPRKGDNAEQSYIMLVNFELEKKKSKVKQLLEKREKNK